MDPITIGLCIFFGLIIVFVVPVLQKTKAVQFIDNLFFWLGIIVLIIILLGGVKFCSAVGSMY